MILLVSVLLAAGTIVESRFSTAVAKRFVYSTWWFNLALLLLGTNGKNTKPVLSLPIWVF